MQKPSKPILLTIVTVQVVSAFLARRDLMARTDDEVRGNKRFWKVFVLLNPGNSLAYWVLGRR